MGEVRNAENSKRIYRDALIGFSHGRIGHIENFPQYRAYMMGWRRGRGAMHNDHVEEALYSLIEKLSSEKIRLLLAN